MARIEKRARAGGRTVYIAKWLTVTGQDRSKTFPSKKDAEAHLTKVQAAKLHGNEFDPATGRMLFREAASLWLDDRKGSLKATTYAAHAERLTPTTTASKTRHARLMQKGQPLRIDPAFGDYPLNKITHDDVQAWVNRLVASGRQPSTVRNLFFVVRQILAWAVMTKKLTANPAEHVQLPGNRTASITQGDNKTALKRSRRRDDPARFLTAAQVAVLAAATPWPYNVFVHTDAWTGLRPGEMIGLRIGDVHLAAEDAGSTSAGESWLSVAESVAVLDGKSVYLDPKTEGSVRDVPLTADTAARLRAYLAVHPNLQDPDAALFPGFSAVPLRLPHMRKRERGTVPPSRLPAAVRDAGAELRAARHEDLPPADRQAASLAGLSVDQAAARLTLDWEAPMRLDSFRKTIWTPAALRANRIAKENAKPGQVPVTIPPGVTPYALRHTYASLSAAAGIKPLALSRRMGHAAVTMTMNVYAHLYRESAADDMAALGAMALLSEATPPNQKPNVIQLRRQLQDGRYLRS